MSKNQRQRVAPPLPADKALKDYSAVVQNGFDDLFQYAHEHKVRTDVPTAADGNVGDIQIVDDGADVYIVLKTRAGWYKTANLTAI